MTKNFAWLISENEQDRAEAEQWWKEATTADKMAVLERIVRPYADPIDEIMSRFAQLAFGQMLEKFGS